MSLVFSEYNSFEYYESAFDFELCGLVVDC